MAKSQLKFYETESFKKNQNVWYQKLKKRGFCDEEMFMGRELVLKNPKKFANPYRRLKCREEKDLKLQYFLKLSQCVSQWQFESKRNKIIMTMLSEGAKLGQIAKKVKCHRQTIRFTVRKYELKWGIRHWKPEQLTSNQAIAS